MAPGNQRLCLKLSENALRSYSFPFLLPAFQRSLDSRPFSSSAASASQIGRAPVSLPENVALRLIEPPKPRNGVGYAREGPRRVMEVEGPLGIPQFLRQWKHTAKFLLKKGKLAMPLPPFILIENDMERKRAVVKVQDPDERKQREMWGTTRACLQNHVRGVSEGHAAILRLVGVGFRATVESEAITLSPEYPGQQFVSLKLGYDHPIELGVPEGVKASTPQPTRILLEGMDKEVVYQFAAKIRVWRIPEPYKGKGIFVNGETIKLKAKKIK